MLFHPNDIPAISSNTSTLTESHDFSMVLDRVLYPIPMDPNAHCCFEATANPLNRSKKIEPSRTSDFRSEKAGSIGNAEKKQTLGHKSHVYNPMVDILKKQVFEKLGIIPNKVENKHRPDGRWFYTNCIPMLNRRTSNMLPDVFQQRNLRSSPYNQYRCFTIQHCEVTKIASIWEHHGNMVPPVSTSLCLNYVCWFIRTFHSIYGC